MSSQVTQVVKGFFITSSLMFHFNNSSRVLFGLHGGILKGVAGGDCVIWPLVECNNPHPANLTTSNSNNSDSWAALSLSSSLGDQCNCCGLLRAQRTYFANFLFYYFINLHTCILTTNYYNNNNNNKVPASSEALELCWREIQFTRLVKSSSPLELLTVRLR